MFGKLGSLNPEARYKNARDELILAKSNLASAEDRLIKATRNFNNLHEEWVNFNEPSRMNK